MKNLIFRLSQTVGLALLCIAALGDQSLQAQNTTGRVVASCGTVTGYPNAGGVGFLTVDTNGQLCSGATGGGGGSVTQGTVPWVVDTVASGGNLIDAINSPIPPQVGTIIIGGVGIDQTIPGTTNAFSLKYLNTTAVDTNSGNKGAGTQRNVLATDQLALPTWGHGANGATAPTSSTQEGCRSASTAPTEVADGQMTPIQCGLGGKQIYMPFTVKELAVRGTATSTDTSAHTVIASAGGSLKNYITGVQCYNSSATSVVITFNDSVTTPLYLPSTGGNNASYNVPLVTAAATAFQFTSPSGLTTIGCAAQGFIGL